MRKLAAPMCIFFVLTLKTYATGIPTIDIANILQTSLTAFESIEQTINQIQQIEHMITQIEQLDRQFENMSGSYDMGALFNDLASQEARRYLPQSWGEIVNIASGLGDTPAEREAKQARELGEIYTSQGLYGDNNSFAAKQHQQLDKQVYGALALSQMAYGKTNSRFKDLEEMSEEIDKAEDMKAATDLNNRLLIELGYLLNQSIQLQAATNTQIAEQRQTDLNERAALNNWTRTRDNAGIISLF